MTNKNKPEATCAGSNTKPKMTTAAVLKPMMYHTGDKPSRYNTNKKEKNTSAEPVSCCKMMMPTGKRKIPMAMVKLLVSRRLIPGELK